MDSLFGEVRRAVRELGVPLETALKAVTSTPAACLQLGRKGAVRAGADADLVLLDRDLEIRTVLARGEVLVRDGTIERFGTFERELMAGLERKRPSGPR